LCLAFPVSRSLGVVIPNIFGSAQAQAIHLFFYSLKLNKSFASAKKKKLNLKNTHNRAPLKYRVSPDLKPDVRIVARMKLHRREMSPNDLG
jgi:hypothetical protein